MNRRVVIVGGGTSTATRLQRLAEDIEIAVLERSEGVSYASCGLPFHIDGTIPEDDLAIVAPLLAGSALGARIGAAATSIVDEDVKNRALSGCDFASSLRFDYGFVQDCGLYTQIF